MSGPKNGHNVNNINQPNLLKCKRLKQPMNKTKVFSNLHDLHADIMFLQDTC